MATMSDGSLDLSEDILLDTGSNVKGGTFMNPSFVANISSSTEPILMDTNVGKAPLMLQGDVPLYGKVYFDSKMRANIFSFGSAQRKS